VQQKPFEVEICVAQVGAQPDKDELYRLTYDGSVQDEPGSIAMGGQAEAISQVVKARHNTDMSLGDGLRLAVEGLASVGGEGGQPRKLEARQLEVAVLDRRRVGRTFRRITGAALIALLEPDGKAELAPADEAAEAPTIAEPGATPADKSPGGTDPVAGGEG
jgi:proteasome alpha subunit